MEQKIAINKYREKQMELVKNSSPNAGYAALKTMGERIGEKISNDLNLNCHEGWTTEQIAEDIADHFSSISNEYSPFSIDDLSLIHI